MDKTADYYELLHVHRDAPVEIIKASYRTLMQRLKMHPDLGGDHAHAALLNVAYETLMDDELRAAYDAQRAEGAQAQPRQESARAERREAPPERHRSRASTGLQPCVFCGTNVRVVPDDDALTCSVCDSPQSNARRLLGDEGASRAIERLPKRQSVVLHRQWPGVGTRAESRDISLNGMLLALDRQPERGEVLRIDCDVCRAVGKVVHVNSSGGGWLAGVEFVAVLFKRTQGAFVSARA